MDYGKKLDERDRGLLHGLIALSQKEPRLVNALALVVAGVEAFRAAREAAAGRAPEEDARFKGETWDEFRNGVAASKRLRDLLADESLADEDALKVATFARIADLTPDGREVLNTQDGPFMNVLSAALDRAKTAADAEFLMEEELGKFITLKERSNDLFQAIHRLDAKPFWQVVLASVEDNDDYTARVEYDSPATRDDAKKSLDEIRTKSQAATTRLESSFRLSRMPRGLFRLAWDSQKLFDDIPQKDSSDVQRSSESRGADALKRLKESHQNEAEWIINGIRLRFAVAQDILSEREFAKLDACEYKWPEVARILTSGPAGVEGLIAVETHFLKFPFINISTGTGSGTTTPPPPPSNTEEERRLSELCNKDAGLRRFLRLRPYFRDIDRKKLLERRLAFAFEPAAPSAPTTSPTTTAATGSTPATDTQPTREQPAQEMTGPLDLSLMITRETPEQGADSVGTGESPKISYKVTASTSGTLSLTTDRTVSVSTSELIGRMFANGGLAGTFDNRNEWYVNLTKMLSGDFDLSSPLASIGKMLYDEFFSELFSDWRGEELKKALAVSWRVRVNVRTGAREVASLPWEWLALPGHEKSLVLSPINSLVRDSRAAAAPATRDDMYPLRVLTVFSTHGENPREAESRLGRLYSTFRGDAVKLVPSEVRPTTPDGLIRDLRDLRPHVLHVEASIIPSYNADGSTEHELLLDIHDGKDTLKLSELETALIENGVQLVTFGNNHGGGFLENPLLDFVAGLISKGLPAAVVATRPVEDRSALTFWNGFYRAWLNGKSVEEAVSTARDELISSRLDWSAFALFGNPLVVSRLSLPPRSSA
jgi:hypothetical protein